MLHSFDILPDVCNFTLTLERVEIIEQRLFDFYTMAAVKKIENRWPTVLLRGQAINIEVALLSAKASIALETCEEFKGLRSAHFPGCMGVVWAEDIADRRTLFHFTLGLDEHFYLKVSMPQDAFRGAWDAMSRHLRNGSTALAATALKTVADALVVSEVGTFDANANPSKDEKVSQ
jgi:hypothetical protein